MIVNKDGSNEADSNGDCRNRDGMKMTINEDSSKWNQIQMVQKNNHNEL